MESKVFNEDCMIGMARYPDKYFDLAVVDPPYGINIGTEIDRSGFKEGTSKNSMTKFEKSMKDKRWDKMTYVPTMSQVELAWTSFKKHSLLKKINSNQLDRFHPTQKPVALYEWIYKNYLPNGGKVIDTHLGSASNRISAYKRGNIDFYGWEIDSDYFRDADKRFNDFVKNYAPAEIEPINATGQIKLL